VPSVEVADNSDSRRAANGQSSVQLPVFACLAFRVTAMAQLPCNINKFLFAYVTLSNMLIFGNINCKHIWLLINVCLLLCVDS